MVDTVGNWYRSWGFSKYSGMEYELIDKLHDKYSQYVWFDDRELIYRKWINDHDSGLANLTKILFDIDVNSQCESHIEVQFALAYTMYAIGCPSARCALIPQYRRGSDRYDFLASIHIPSDGYYRLSLIECDGAEFHKDNLKDYERDKNTLSGLNHLTTYRFSGKELFRDAIQCVHDTVKCMRVYRDLRRVGISENDAGIISMSHSGGYWRGIDAP